MGLFRGVSKKVSGYVDSKKEEKKALKFALIMRFYKINFYQEAHRALANKKFSDQGLIKLKRFYQKMLSAKKNGLYWIDRDRFKSVLAGLEDIFDKKGVVGEKQTLFIEKELIPFLEDCEREELNNIK